MQVNAEKPECGLTPGIALVCGVLFRLYCTRLLRGRMDYLFGNSKGIVEFGPTGSPKSPKVKVTLAKGFFVKVPDDDAGAPIQDSLDTHCDP